MDLLLFPFNGNAVEALDAAKFDFNVIGFVDDNKCGQEFHGIPIYNRSAFNEFKSSKVLVVPGSPKSFKNRRNIIRDLNLEEKRFATVIHPSANISKYSQIGFNTLILSGSSLNATSKVGNHVIILNNSVIHHDSVISNYSIIGSSVVVAGNVFIDENCYIGSATSIINGIEILSNTLIGIGSNVIKSLDKDQKIVGNPGRSLK